MTMFSPARSAPWAPTLDRMAGSKPAGQTEQPLTEREAVTALHQLFEFNALSDRVTGLRHRDVLGAAAVSRCAHDTAFGACSLARRKGEMRCTFHENTPRFAVLGLKAEDVYAGAPVQARIKARYDALGL